MLEFEKYVKENFGSNLNTFVEALDLSPGAKGYIHGAISELLLKKYLEDVGFSAVRIKEKPSGGNDAKNSEARGDFYIQLSNTKSDDWLVVESKGLKSNSEFRGGKLSTHQDLYSFLLNRTFKRKTKKEIFEKGHKTYLKAKTSWNLKNSGKVFPPFGWSDDMPGPDYYSLDGLWKTNSDLKDWVYGFSNSDLSEEAYRNLSGPIRILETHKPSSRVAPITELNNAAPLVSDFNILSVDLFLRTDKHEFVFANSEQLSHSPTSPEHLYQNYTIDILVKDLKTSPIVSPPWYRDIKECIEKTKPKPRKLDRSQVDDR
jgi:hypothetical protein